MTLPNYSASQTIYSDGAAIRHFIRKEFENYDLSGKSVDTIEYFKSALWMWAATLKLSLRDIEKAISMYVFADFPAAPGAAAYLIIMKLRQPELFNKYHRETRQFHIDSRDRLTGYVAIYQNDPNQWAYKYLCALQQYHSVQMESNYQWDQLIFEDFRALVINENFRLDENNWLPIIYAKLDLVLAQ